MQCSAQALFVATSQAVSCEISGETVILDVPSGRYFALDPIGTQIWQWLQEPLTLEALCERLQTEYDVTPQRCREDVSALLSRMAEHGLVKNER